MLNQKTKVFLLFVFFFSFLTSCSEDMKKNTPTDKSGKNGVTQDQNANTSNDKLNPKVIYGDDNRQELYKYSDPLFQQLGDSTVALINNNKIQTVGSITKINSSTYGDNYLLCPSEPFREQPNAAFCSGFLVQPDVIVSAGHCMQTLKDCQNTKFVFGYTLDSQGNAPNLISNDEVYTCKEILHSELNASGTDFSIIRLDRKVVNHQPLKLRTQGQLQKGDSVLVIGHPSGLPTKIADKAEVRSIENGYFVTNLDTYGGNSGSAVFNQSTGEVEGVLVRGEMDYSYQESCRVSNKCKTDECRGEDVTAISYVLNQLPQEEGLRGPASSGDSNVSAEYSQQGNFRIPDNSRQGLSVSVHANQAPAGRKVRVRVNISHPWRGDLYLVLTSPDGRSFVLQNRAGSSQDNVVGTFGKDLKSVDDLSRLSQVNVAGDWTLTVYDLSPQDIGQLNDFSLEFIPQ